MLVHFITGADLHQYSQLVSLLHIWGQTRSNSSVSSTLSVCSLGSLHVQRTTNYLQKFPLFQACNKAFLRMTNIFTIPADKQSKPLSDFSWAASLGFSPSTAWQCMYRHQLTSFPPWTMFESFGFRRGYENVTGIVCTTAGIWGEREADIGRQIMTFIDIDGLSLPSSVTEGWAHRVVRSATYCYSMLIDALKICRQWGTHPTV